MSGFHMGLDLTYFHLAEVFLADGQLRLALQEALNTKLVQLGPAVSQSCTSKLNQTNFFTQLIEQAIFQFFFCVVFYRSNI